MAEANSSRERILTGIRHCLLNSLDIEPEQVREEAFLVRDIGLASIDVLDLVFSLSRDFHISLDMGDIQDQLLDGMSEKEFFNEDRTVTARGYQRIGELVPGFDPNQRDEPLTDTGLFEFIQVRHLVDLVEQRSNGSWRQSAP